MNAVEIATRMETDAIKFYSEAANKTDNPVGRKMFLSIVADEKRHLEMLQRFFNNLNLDFNSGSPMRAMKSIFEEMKSEMLQRAEATKNELEAFQIAMTMEKEGIEFYKKATLEAPSEKEKKLFEMLIREEEQHYAIFANTYFFMKESGSWFMWEEHSIVDGGTPWA